MRDVTILGAGLVGSALAILLRKKGCNVTVYERRSDMRQDKIGGGRSINLALSTRGWKALDYTDIREEIEDIALPMKGRYLHQTDDTVAFQAYGKNGEAIYSVSRSELNKRLMNKAEQLGVRICFNKTSIGIDIQENRVHLKDEKGQTKTFDADLLFGADGAFSSLRTAYTHLDRTDFEQFYIRNGYKELSIPPGKESEKWLLKNDGLHIWPRHKFMMIALPNVDGSFTCTLFFPFEGKPSFQSIQQPEEIQSFIQQQFPDAFLLMPTLKEDFVQNPISSLVTIKVGRWHYRNKSCIIGDAAHAVVPFYGQGMNAGFEDCTVLFDLIEKNAGDWESIFAEYEQLRKPNGNAVADLSLLNYVEMQDKVADPAFLERKKIEKELGRLYPQYFNSLYEMVSFSHLPYEKVLKSTRAQDKLLGHIQEKGDFFTKVQQPEYKQWLEQQLMEYKAEAV